MFQDEDNWKRLPVNPEGFQHAFDAAEQSVEQLHRRLSEGVQYVGYIREALKVIRRTYSALAIRATEEPELVPLIVGAIEFAQAITEQIRKLDSEIRPSMAALYSVSASAFSFNSTANIVPGLGSPGASGVSPLSPPSFLDRDRQGYARRFDQLDTALGNTYRQAWESYFGSQADPLRSALFLIRQTFDHFFNFLASDEKVRASQYWKPKAGDDPSQVYRTERIEYAAFTHVKDASQARILAASAKQLNEAYQALNKAHKRGELHPEEDAAALATMSRMLEDWIDALESPSPGQGAG